MFELHPTSPDEVGLNTDRMNAIPDYFQTHYIDTGKLPCMATMVSRGGEIVHEEYRGTERMNGEGPPIKADTIFRIYSMTKPVTSVAAMMLFEKGLIRLEHPVSRYLPEFADVMVWDGGDLINYKTRKPDREMTVLDLFTHTSGITYGFLFQHEVDALYRREKIGRPDMSLRDMARNIAKMPLVFSPGDKWNYGHSIDILGAIVEVVSGQTLEVFFREHIFGPLRMVDTDFFVPADKISRLTTCYSKDAITKAVTVADEGGAASKAYRAQPPLLNAGGGLVSTMGDYHRFCLMLLRGGTLDDARIPSPKTVEFMRQNHLPKNQTIKAMGDKLYSETGTDGTGFGLGGSVVINAVETMAPTSEGVFSWGGLASTFFWIDPEEELIAIQMTQLMPSSTYPIRPQLQQLVYAAIDW